jgi:GNAT superfamily N-acetyltransferase
MVGVELTWLDPADLDEGMLDGAVALLEAARQVDCPHELARTVPSYTADLQHGWDGEPPTAAVSRDGSGRAVGLLQVSMSEWDNHHVGFVEVTVDPAVRRQGIGRQLLDVGIARIREAGRTLVVTESFDTRPATAFAEALGMERAIASVQRRQVLRALDTARLAREFDTAQRAAAAYELVRLPSPLPAELLAPVAEMVAAINDAPLDDLEIEDEVYTAERVRAYETAQRLGGHRLYRVVARHRQSGELAGHTVVAVDTERPTLGHQHDTAVARTHRGHRLGALLKADMVLWLAEVEPQLETVDTWNAESNDHMIGVNERLGYRIVARALEFQRRI